ncbi:ATP-binding protein [Pleurocapsales cyanobacterium LEGE 10410]|nr:ATP-binding protein [Pleurocapsales cyanobacterium LEGE 10410]
MDVEAVVILVDREVYRYTKNHLNDLQQTIVALVWQGRKYWEIADEYGCTEGHAKDTGSLLWKLLSKAWGKKVTKSNFRSLLKRQLKSLTKIEQTITELTSTAVELVSSNTLNTNFFGRQQAIATLQNLASRGNKIIVLQGEGGVGKTTLARHFLAQQGFELILEVLMAKETANIVAVASVVEEWLQRDLNEDSGKEFGVTLARFKRYLEQHRVGILIDNLEPALDNDGRFITSHRDYVELLRILASPQVRSTTIVTSRDRLCEAEIDLTHYRLSGLDLAAWQGYFDAHQIETKPTTLAPIHQTYGGNAKAMGILCGIIQEDYQGDIKQYWQENCQDPLVKTDLKNLVASQFARLQRLDPQAYLLLCRLGCYRYQDAEVSLPGLLCLLWDIENSQRRMIESLRNRSLLEFAGGRYWLHPMVRAEARARLQSSPQEWETAHRQVANFFTARIIRIDSIQDGLTALEACYHYLELKDYAAAARVILQSRENQWGQFLTLGTTLYRLGIVQPLLTAIARIIEHTEHLRHHSELNNILGDLYWTTGKVHQAIACQQQTIVTSQNCRQLISQTPENKHDLYYWRMLEVDSLLSLGLYNTDLWELATAADLFQQVIDLADNTKHHSWSEKAALGLALVNSHANASDSPAYIVSRLYELIIDLEDQIYNTGRFAYFMQILGQILFNHRQIEPATTIWHRAIAFSQSGHYTQIKAKSLIGLGKIERQHNFDRAYTYHQQATELLDKIAAKCDLAEAYFQWGITCRVKDLVQSQDFFQRAIAIYRQIPAPKQIERIRSIIAE